MTETPQTPPPLTDVAGLVDLPTLARHLGVTPAAIRNAHARGAVWLPAPAGQLHGYVWRLEALGGVRDDTRRTPGRPRSSTPPPVASED